MKNRICLITGGTSGVGRATAMGLAKLGATVVILSRSEARGKAVAGEIQSAAQNRNVMYRVLDLSNLEKIYQFADQFKKEFQRLHVLSNNAAILPFKKELTKQGIEKIFAVNYLSHFVLTHLLMDILKTSAPARVLTVSGSPSLIKFGRPDLEDINLDKHFNPLKATIRVAAAKVLFSHELAKRLDNTGVTSNTFHSGFVKTNLTQNLPKPLCALAQMGQIFFSRECKTSVYLASSPDVEKVTGKFFKNMKIVNYNPPYALDEYGSKLWEKSEALANLS